MLEDASLQLWFTSQPLWEWRWVCGHSHAPACSEKVAMGTPLLPLVPSQPGQAPPPPPQLGSAGCGADGTFLSLSTAQASAVAGSWEQQRLFAEFGQSCTLSRTQISLKKLNKLLEHSRSQAGTQIPSSCLSHERAPPPGNGIVHCGED